MLSSFLQSFHSGIVSNSRDIQEVVRCHTRQVLGGSDVTRHTSDNVFMRSVATTCRIVHADMLVCTYHGARSRVWSTAHASRSHDCAPGHVHGRGSRDRTRRELKHGIWSRIREGFRSGRRSRVGGRIQSLPFDNRSRATSSSVGHISSKCTTSMYTCKAAALGPA